MHQITIAIDAMGGDFGPSVTVPASLQALSQFPNLKIILVGDSQLISTELTRLNYRSQPHLSIVHSQHSISNTTLPAKALRHRQGSSMQMVLDFVASGEADACVSGGNTGALMGLSRFTLKLIPGVERPALISQLPIINSNEQRQDKKLCTWMLDLGANISCDADTLFQFAIMGDALAEQTLGRKVNVALLNIGEEEIKGNDQIKGCSEMLAECQDINYIGYLEADKLYQGIADVIVCDGFTGNVCLKTSEGIASSFLNVFKNKLSISEKSETGRSIFPKNRVTRVKQVIIKWLFGDIITELKELSPDQYNGASLIGLRGIVIKSHGHADELAFNYAIKEAIHEIEYQIPNRISERIETVLFKRH